jgi:hypothetical protein
LKDWYTFKLKKTYTASGAKIKNDLPGKNLYYIGNFVYENGSLKYRRAAQPASK